MQLAAGCTTLKYWPEAAETAVPAPGRGRRLSGSVVGRLRLTLGARPTLAGPGLPSPSYLQHAFILLGADVHSLDGQRRRLHPALDPLHLLGGHCRSVRRLLWELGGRETSPLGCRPVCTGVRALAPRPPTCKLVQSSSHCPPARSRPAAECGAGAGVGGYRAAGGAIGLTRRGGRGWEEPEREPGTERAGIEKFLETAVAKPVRALVLRARI